MTMLLFVSLKKEIKRKMPEKWWGHLSAARFGARNFIRWNYWQFKHPGASFCCPYCKSTFGKFIPYVNIYEISRKADIISGQSIEPYACPRCFSNDRERLLYFFLRARKGFLDDKKILHFAPERNLYKFIASSNCHEYVCADLNTKNYLHFSENIQKIDLTAINYPDESFDVVIGNHVMEHIPEDVRAMKEIFRILKKGGVAILMVPIGGALEDTYEDFSKLSEDDRAVAFGQCDHVRVYAEKNYMERLQSAGFDIDICQSDLDDEEVVKYGINSREKIYLGLKCA